MARNVSQKLNYIGEGYLDNKMSVASLTELSSMNVSLRAVGLTVTVTNSETTEMPIDFWLVGGVTNPCWKIKHVQPLDTVADLDVLAQSVQSKKKDGTVNGTALFVGFTATVLDDGSGNTVDYMVSEIVDYLPIWKRKDNSEEIEDIQAQLSSITEGNATIARQIDDINAELDKIQDGQIVYVTTKQYSYADASGNTYYTTDISTIPEGTAYNTVTPGLYVKDINEKLERLSVTVTGQDLEDPTEDDKEL